MHKTSTLFKDINGKARWHKGRVKPETALRNGWTDGEYMTIDTYAPSRGFFNKVKAF